MPFSNIAFEQVKGSEACISVPNVNTQDSFKSTFCKDLGPTKCFETFWNQTEYYY